MQAAEAGLSCTAEFRWFVPGRIEVLGKHTDYAGGRSLLCTAERGMCVAAATDSRDRLVIADAVLQRRAEFALDGRVLSGGGGWTNYVSTALARVSANFGALRGLRVAIASDLPRSSGMSSSSVLVIAVFLALSESNGLPAREPYRQNIRSREDLAAYIACIENGQSFGSLAGQRGVGTFGGSEDHTAILCCRPAELALYRFCPAQREDGIAFPRDHIFVIGCSGVIADKTGTAREKYNRASRSAAAVLQAWREASGRSDATLFAAATSSPHAPAEIRRVLRDARSGGFSSSELMDRFDQFCRETLHVIPAGLEALRRGDLAEFGWWVEESQSAAELYLGNQVPETVHLARSARDLGAPAASAFGAGFGGAVWALVKTDEAQEFLPRWRDAYAAFPERAPQAQFFLTTAGPAVVRISTG